MSNRTFAAAVEYSREPWTLNDKRMPFFTAFRGGATGDLHVKLWRFLVTIMILGRCVDDRDS